METAIINHLLQKRYCTLPGIGRLQYEEETQALPQADKIMFSHRKNIVLKKFASDSNDSFYRSLQACQTGPRTNVTESLKTYCAEILALKNDEKLPLHNVGYFYRKDSGDLSFETEEAFKNTTTLYAERIVKANAKHEMLVGDTATNTEDMAAYYSKVPAAKRTWWWVAALVIALASAAIIAAYFLAGYSNGGFGNSISIF